MKKLIRLSLLSALAFVGVATAALAQVNVVPQVGVASATIRQKTYTASSVGLVPAATATDIFCLNGSTTKNIAVRRIVISGTAGTAITTPFLINLNHSLDTIGTPATGLALPVAVPLNTSNPTVTAAPTAWTANGTVNDATPALLAVMMPSVSVTTSTNQPTEMRFSSDIDFYEQGIDILKAATVVQQLCVNLNGVTITTGKLNITFEWTEN